MMDIIDHGEWVVCDKPDDYPVKLPPNILFARRVSDGVDWYQFQRKELTAADTIKMVIRNTDEGWAVLTTTHDATHLFPAGSRLIEVRGATENHESFRTQFVDLDKKQFTPSILPQDRPNMMKSIMEELGMDEAQMKAKHDALLKNRRQHG